MVSRITVICCALCCITCEVAHAQYEDAHRGDIIDINGEKALVFYTDGYGHGSAINIKAFRGKKKAWGTDKKCISAVRTENSSDGLENTNAVYDYCKANNVSLSVFPAFEWCKSLGEGWYIPSIKQMETFVNYWLGNTQEFDWDSEDEYELGNDMSTKEINEKMIDAGGTPFVSSVSGFISGIYTSTKTNDDRVFVFEMNKTKNVWRFAKLNTLAIGTYTMGRAFYDF